MTEIEQLENQIKELKLKESYDKLMDEFENSPQKVGLKLIND